MWGISGQLIRIIQKTHRHRQLYQKIYFPELIRFLEPELTFHSKVAELTFITFRSILVKVVATDVKHRNKLYLPNIQMTKIVL